MLDAKLIRTKPHVVEAACKSEYFGALTGLSPWMRNGYLGKVEELKGFTTAYEVGRRKEAWILPP